MRFSSQTSLPDKQEWNWPFSLANLTAGCRRHFKDTSIHVEQIEDYPLKDRRPSIGRIRAIKVHYRSSDGPGECTFVVKEPHGTTRAGLAGVGRREVGVYHSLSNHLPLSTPSMISGSPSGDWLILEILPQASDPEHWSKEDYLQAIDKMAVLHDRFWGLGEDLYAFPWLSRALEGDFEVHIAAATQALDRIMEIKRPIMIANKPHRIKLFTQLIEKADRVIAPLISQPSTLLHGDYWPGNIAAASDHRQIVYDWQLAGVGPGVLDLIVFINKSSWWFDDLPLSQEEMIERYRDNILSRAGIQWDNEAWSEIWDHALMWRFLQDWVDLLAVTPEPLLLTRAKQLESVWLEPVERAIEKRLT
ncbi:MAG: aminoglycoside phosphotransferase family protein [Anaerolineales bacterium]|nr:aminoglycoside phosphotransferase family protein [Anaerolineales bacterium]